MKNALQFLAKFVLISALLYACWVPFSRVYFAFLSLEVNAVFGLVGHDMQFISEDRGISILYQNIFPPPGFKRDIQLPVLNSISIHFNLIVLIALFGATSNMDRRLRLKGILSGVLLLSLLHIAHVYYISHFFIWDYVDRQLWPAGTSEGQVQLLIRNVEERFPRGRRPYIDKLQDYWNHFLREGAPLLIWVYFVYARGKKEG
ncbi:MAG: hypothetical protein O2954_06065 [bacterium]|nr:hypothetical protein [bacterium]